MQQSRIRADKVTRLPVSGGRPFDPPCTYGFAKMIRRLTDKLTKLPRVLKRGHDSVLSSDPHTKQLEPFVFFHIPKTAGSTVRLIVSSLFDEHSVFDGINLEHYHPEKLKHRLTRDPKGVFVGHMNWDAVDVIADALNRPPNVFTVLRHPVSHMRSQLAFIDVLATDGITHSTTTYGDKIDFVTYWNEERRDTEGADLASMQVAMLIGEGFGPLRNLIKSTNEDDASQGLTTARDILQRRIDGGLVTLLFEDLRRSVDLLCAKYSFPHQGIPTRKLNATGAGHSIELTPNQSQTLATWHGLMDKFDTQIRNEFEENYDSEFNAVTDIKAHLNAKYRKAVFDCMEPASKIRLPAENSWPGYDWSLRQRNRNNQYWRTPNTTGTSVLLVKLANAGNYMVSLRFLSNPDPARILSLEVNGQPARLLPDRMSLPAPEWVHKIRRKASGYAVTKRFRISACQLPAPGTPIEFKFNFGAESSDAFKITGIEVDPVR